MKIITLTDIGNEYGTHIEPWALTGSTTARTTLSWPAQSRPTDSDWTLWRKTIKSVLLLRSPKIPG
eukprot:3571762-Ditylum_brightwellii.AAC.1